MPRTIALTDKQLINELQSLYGVEITAADIRGFVNHEVLIIRL